ncbi:hypothetical protein BGX26_002488 [Mortierella sp. AD094]|nr:hypothetical protein BGX26_002488 [Mortierella sp. AD094]
MNRILNGGIPQAGMNSEPLESGAVENPIGDPTTASIQGTELPDHERFNLSLPEYPLDTVSTQHEVRAALQAYYTPFLAIQRVSGDMMDLESCYMDLTVVQALDQRLKDKEELRALELAFHRVFSQGKSDELLPIPTEELFYKHKLLDGREDVPKAILIQGRAGVGKTTLCKKLVLVHQTGSWRDRFDAVLWLRLHQLKILRVRTLEDLLRENHFSHCPAQEQGSLVSALTDRVRGGKVLFLLDGLDEIVPDMHTDDGIALKVFLKQPLQQDHVIVTSRPSGVDMSILPKLDLELEIIGFSPQNVKNYLTKVLNSETARKVQDFIQQTPLIQNLVSIPAQLDVLCYSWTSFPLNKESVTMTRPYQAMVERLWRKDAMRLQKSVNGEILTQQQIEHLRPRQIDELMSDEIEYLGYLAFKGLRNNHQIEFDESTLNDAMEELDQLREKTDQGLLPSRLLESVKQTSFLHTTDADLDAVRDSSQRSWYFLDLTF